VSLFKLFDSYMGSLLSIKYLLSSYRILRYQYIVVFDTLLDL